MRTKSLKDAATILTQDLRATDATIELTNAETNQRTTKQTQRKNTR